jgi:NADH-quinone oxidoreductase subunit M
MADAVLLNVVLYLPLLGTGSAAGGAVASGGCGSSGVARSNAGPVRHYRVALLAVRSGRRPAIRNPHPWIPGWGVNYQIGLDGYNLLLVLLTAFLGPLVVAGSFTAIRKDTKLFYAMVFLVQFAMLGAFVAQDLFLFYLFWEAMMIPMFFIIGIWGGERRIYATLKFVLYTAFGSILMLAAVIYLVYSLYASAGVASFAFADLYRVRLPLPSRRCCSPRSGCRSRSRCRSCRCTHGCPTHMSRRRPPGR